LKEVEITLQSESRNNLINQKAQSLERPKTTFQGGNLISGYGSMIYEKVNPDNHQIILTRRRRKTPLRLEGNTKSNFHNASSFYENMETADNSRREHSLPFTNSNFRIKDRRINYSTTKSRNDVRQLKSRDGSSSHKQTVFNTTTSSVKQIMNQCVALNRSGIDSTIKSTFVR